MLFPVIATGEAILWSGAAVPTYVRTNHEIAWPSARDDSRLRRVDQTPGRPLRNAAAPVPIRRGKCV